MPNDRSSPIIEQMGVRYGELKSMETDPGNERARMHFEISSRNFFGMRSWITTVTGGEAVVTSELLPMRIRDKTQEPTKQRNGVLISNTQCEIGGINSCDYARLAGRGKLFISTDDKLYPGMIMGELREGSEDIDTNICKKHDGYEKAKPCSGGGSLSIEQSLTYLAEDECLEVTPKRLAMRKLILDNRERELARKMARKAEKMKN